MVSLFCASSIAAVFKGNANPDPAPLGAISHPLVLATWQLFAKLEVSSFT